MSAIPADLQYTKEHEWVKSDDNQRFQVGITDYAQGALGDIVYVQLPKVGDAVTEGKVCGEVESTKSVSEIFSPLTGKVVEINEALNTSPETINSDPYGAGWMFVIEAQSPSVALLSAAQYGDITG